jgi:hypothetical protein
MLVLIGVKHLVALPLKALSNEMALRYKKLSRFILGRTIAGSSAALPTEVVGVGVGAAPVLPPAAAPLPLLPPPFVLSMPFPPPPTAALAAATDSVTQQLVASEYKNDLVETTTVFANRVELSKFSAALRMTDTQENASQVHVNAGKFAPIGPHILVYDVCLIHSFIHSRS